MKKILTVVLACIMALSMALCVNAADHDHEFVDGVCTVCGKYEEPFITRIPLKEKYTKENDQKGTLETLTYTTPVFGQEDKTAEKVLQVYLPYGYDPEGCYNVVYLMHGGGESEYYWLNDEPVYEGTKSMGKTTKNVLDNMLAAGTIEPTIFVAPTTNLTVDGERVGEDQFAQELREIIVPMIDLKYATYAKGDVTNENLIATRDHRAFCGFSMGSICTIQSVMMKNLDYFAYFGSFSGAKTDIGEFKEALESFGQETYPVKYWYNGNGTSDIAHDEHDEFAHAALEQMPDWFQNGKNFCWIDFKGGSHAYNCWIVDLYNSMLVFFK